MAGGREHRQTSSAVSVTWDFMFEGRKPWESPVLTVPECPEARATCYGSPDGIFSPGSKWTIPVPLVLFPRANRACLPDANKSGLPLSIPGSGRMGGQEGRTVRGRSQCEVHKLAWALVSPGVRDGVRGRRSVSSLSSLQPPQKGRARHVGCRGGGGGYTEAEVQMAGGGALFAWTAFGRQSVRSERQPARLLGAD